jgi:hypothetical protein
MSVSMPITKARIKNHFHYHLWKYVLLVVLSIFVWNFLFTTTHYRTPDHLKVELYAEGYQTPETDAAMKELMARIHQEVMPDMEEVSHLFLIMDETYGPMQLTVWAAAGQGDAYLLSKDRFLPLAQGGAMIDLQPWIDKGTLRVDGLDLTAGMVRDSETGERALRGIPTDALPGLAKHGLLTQGGFLSVLGAGGNEEEAVRLLDYLIADGRANAQE